MDQPITIAIVDDDPYILESFAARIAETDGLVCTGTYTSAEEFIVEYTYAHPKVVFMDVGLPGMSGIDCIRFIRHTAPETHFLVYSVFEDAQTVVEAIKAGASGYLLKSAPLEKLIRAVNEVLQGESPLTGSVATTIMHAFRDVQAPQNAPQELEAKEKTLLAMLTEGYRYKDIATRFNQTERHVKEQIRGIYHKLQINQQNLYTTISNPMESGFGRYLHTNVKHETEEQCHQIILNYFETDKPYLAERYTIGQLADAIGFPVYVVSQTINRKFKKNFFDLINHYRILEASVMLKENHGKYTVDGIAAICGFNSRPTFYKAFRKEFGMTPGEYSAQ
jgi:DNA-binding NarL/FixJ family response regulator/methylphosphotriester-DNA--protein-cysteine methyltransferase